MGQEIGHAYEDLLHLALSTILPSLKHSGLHLRISPSRRLHGFSGNIDHLVEVLDEHGEWVPYVLFMEKHSDSANESEKAFRRHLEEYVQVNTLRTSGKPAPKLVVNLIYGEADGWKPSIIQQAKQFLRPTLYLPDRDYYVALRGMVLRVVSKHGPKFNRRLIKPHLIRAAKSASSFASFVSDVKRLLEKPPILTKTQNAWLSSMMQSSSNKSAFRIRSLCYARKGLTELLLLPPSLRQQVLDKLVSCENSAKVNSLSVRDWQTLQLCSQGLQLQAKITARTVIFPSYWLCGLDAQRVVKLCSELESIFFSRDNPLQMEANDHLAYFDIREDSFIKAVEDVAQQIAAALGGRPAELVNALASPAASATKAVNRKQTRIQNLVLEATMAVCSVLASSATKTRRDLSLSNLGRLAKIPQGTLTSIRGGKACTRNQAKAITGAVERFLKDAFSDKQRAKVSALASVRLIKEWRSSASVRAVPTILDPVVVMSASWMRHNQLNSHPIFNPLGALHWLNARKRLSEKYTSHGFPQKRSANVFEVVGHKAAQDTAYEFSCVFWNAETRHLCIHETCSVIHLKHTSDKCKELAARMRVVRSALEGHCRVSSTLVVDGDWTAAHMSELNGAGWGVVQYSNEFLKEYTAIIS